MLTLIKRGKLTSSRKKKKLIERQLSENCSPQLDEIKKRGIGEDDQTSVRKKPRLNTVRHRRTPALLPECVEDIDIRLNGKYPEVLSWEEPEDLVKMKYFAPRDKDIEAGKEEYSSAYQSPLNIDIPNSSPTNTSTSSVQLWTDNDTPTSSLNNSQVLDSKATTPTDAQTPITLSYASSVVSSDGCHAETAPASPTESNKSNQSSLSRWINRNNSISKLKKAIGLQKNNSFRSRPLSTVESVSESMETTKTTNIISPIIPDAPQEIDSKSIQIHELPADIENTVPEERRTRNIAEEFFKCHQKQQDISHSLSDFGIKKIVKDTDLMEDRDKLISYLSDNLENRLYDAFQNNPFKKRKFLMDKMILMDQLSLDLKKEIDKTKDLEHLTSGKVCDTLPNSKWHDVAEQFLRVNKRMDKVLHLTRSVYRMHYDILFNEMPFYHQKTLHRKKIDA